MNIYGRTVEKTLGIAYLRPIN